jgi:hypothetical protein
MEADHAGNGQNSARENHKMMLAHEMIYPCYVGDSPVISTSEEQRHAYTSPSKREGALGLAGSGLDAAAEHTDSRH